MSPEALQVLRGAYTLIEREEDWSSHGPGTARTAFDDGPRCMLIAVQHAWRRLQFPREPYAEACDRLNNLIGPKNKGLGMPLGIWNDTPGRTHAEVLALLDRAQEDQP